jgi:hypothetical protein
MMYMKSSISWDITLCSPLKVNQHVPPKRQLTFNGLHGVISHTIQLFETTAVIPSNPTYLIQVMICTTENYGSYTLSYSIARKCHLRESE